jgi:hypothetical protein
MEARMGQEVEKRKTVSSALDIQHTLLQQISERNDHILATIGAQPPPANPSEDTKEPVNAVESLRQGHILDILRGLL